MSDVTGKMVLKNCRIVDGAGNPGMDDMVMVIDRSAGSIVCMEKSDSLDSLWLSDQHDLLDLSGYTVLPGLFNVHTHLGLKLPFTSYYLDPYPVSYWALICYRRAVEALVCGVTSLRCPGGPNGADISVRNAIDNMMLQGPRLIVAGGLLLAHGGHGHNSVGSIQCSGVAQFREAARTQLREGADFIKICLTGGLGTPGEKFQDKQMTDDEIDAVVEIAHMAGKRVAAHAGGDKPIRDAVHLGVDCIEHGYVLTEDTAKLMADAGTFLVPTLAVTHAFEYLEAHGSPAYHVDKAREASHFHAESIQKAINSGVKIAVGTDLLPSDPIDGTTATIREIELLVGVGMNPLEAIRAATLSSAELCQVDEITGSLEVGKQADLIVVCGNPDKSISDLRNIEMVVKGGHVVWSNLPGYQVCADGVLPLGFATGQGTFCDW